MIFIGIGANLASPVFGPPRATCEAALGSLEDNGISVVRRSRWYESSPQPPSGDPWYVNGVAEIESSLAPDSLLAALHEVEAAFGRVRTVPNAPRVLDLDLLAYHQVVRDGPVPPVVPHPRLSERAFVLLPLADLAPEWQHPRTCAPVAAMIDALPPGQVCRPLESPGNLDF